jgi:mannose-6-phosphate isomerase-like protein (cupin superfamily)
MIRKINKPTIIKAAGNKPKRIEEYIGLVNSETREVSVARMISPQRWIEPGQKPEFNEYTVVLKGTLKLKLKDQEIEVKAGEAVIVEKGEWVQYSTPHVDGAEYIAVCLPAFSPDSVHRDVE